MAPAPALISVEGIRLGTLCVIDRVPRKLRLDRIAALQVLSEQAMTQFVLRRANAFLTRALSKEKQKVTELEARLAPRTARL